MALGALTVAHLSVTSDLVVHRRRRSRIFTKAGDRSSAAEPIPLNQDDSEALPSRGGCCGDPRRTPTDDENVAAHRLGAL
jgi:hypothetical protein